MFFWAVSCNLATAYRKKGQLLQNHIYQSWAGFYALWEDLLLPSFGAGKKVWDPLMTLSKS